MEIAAALLGGYDGWVRAGFAVESGDPPKPKAK
jgi:3-mercaptopyruvate sulfurtransferase SseA